MYKIKSSPYAKIFYNEWLLDPTSSRYNISIDQTLYGNLDVQRLSKALQRYISEHVILNSHIQNIDGEPHWVPNNSITELEYLDASVNSSELLNYISRSFDLYTGPLYRFKLVRIRDNVYRFSIVMHHLVIDGSAFLDPGVFEAISNYYNNENYTVKNGINEQIKLITDLTELLYRKTEQDGFKYKEFWRQKLLDVDKIDLTFLRLNKNFGENEKAVLEDSNYLGTIKFSYGESELIKLNQLKLKYGITPYSYSQVIFVLLLYRYTGQGRLAISYPITIKEKTDFAQGAQINTNIIPYQFDQTTTIIDLFNQNKEFLKFTLRDEVKYGYYPIADIIRASGNNTGLLNVCFAQTFFRERAFNFEGIIKTELHAEFNINGVTKDILLFEQDARKDKNELSYRVRYDKKTINEELLNNFVKAYERLFLEVLKDLLVGEGSKPIFSYSLLDEEQYHKLIYEFNQTERDYLRDKTIQVLFEEQALKTPDSIAVVYEDNKLTYKELNRKANQLARYLQNGYIIKPDDLVALCLDRNEIMIVAMLGVLKSGGAYIPIDTNYPNERIGYILKDTRAKVVLINNKYKDRLQQIVEQKKLNLSIIIIDDEEIQAELVKQDIINPITLTTSSNLIYVIYTSGTTGDPKGVLIEHRSVVNYVEYLISDNGLNNKSIGSQYAGFGFDALVIEVYPILLSGGVLYILGEEDRLDVKKINAFFMQKGVNYAFLPPKVAEVFFGLRNDKLITLIVGGEKLEYFINQRYRVVNAYGPTEATVQSTSFKIDHPYYNIPIGKPISNVKCYVTDSDLHLLPVGTIGELMIGGECLARGYLGDYELTQKKFIDNPFQSEKEKSQGINSKMYMTGDLVRLLPNGNLEFIARNDSQVKIRGYRIETKEIESKLLEYNGIKQAVVLAQESIDNASRHAINKYLVAYYVADRKLDESLILAYLATKLPEYMLPQMLIYLIKLPLTVRGKLNTDVLVKLINDVYVAPKTILQNQMVNVWSELLGIDKESLSITDNFFKLGGNSISAVNLVAKLSKIKECKGIKAVDIFKHATIEQLSCFIESISYRSIITTNNKNKLETDIAIIAMSGAFSGCENLDQYWRLIQEGIEGVKHYTHDECRQLGVIEEILANPNFVPTSGCVPNVDKFDAGFWGLAPNEAKLLDPQIRKFLEHCWYVLENAGYLHIRDKMNIGVFVGNGNSGYFSKKTNIDGQLLNMRDISQIYAKDILATKISYLLGLTGVASNINTACSTSLVAVVEGCIHLMLGYCNMAIVGGVSLLMPEEIGHIYQEGLIYSRENYCRVFDNKASGIIQGSGIGVVLLKRLSEAQKDKDNIIAVIKGYAINNDGNRKISYTAPSIVGQKECIINAQRMAGVSSNDIDYVECHGTGTKLGDPIEIQALNEAFEYNTDGNRLRSKCIIGSVKANIGHADYAAGIAGLIKVCQMLKYKIIPGQINYNTPNPELRLKNTTFQVITKLKRWNRNGNLPRIAGISSFGIGGTNAHMIISEYVPNELMSKLRTYPLIQKQKRRYVLPLSAKSWSSLKSYKEDFIDYLMVTKDNIKNIAYILQLKREHFAYRLSVVADSVTDAINQLRANVNINKIGYHRKHDVVFVFSESSDQYANISLELYQYDNDYKKSVDECIKLINKYTNVQFKKFLFPKLFDGKALGYDSEHNLWIRLASFVVEYSLAKLLESININASCYVGYGIGEYVIATLAGVFSLDDAIKLIIFRERLIKTTPKEMAKQFVTKFREVRCKSPRKRFISNVTGKFITADEAISCDYWSNYLYKQIPFAKSISTLLDNYRDLFFIEIVAGKSEESFTRQLDMTQYTVIQLLNFQKDGHKGTKDIYCKESILNKLWIGGYNTDFNNYYGYASEDSRVVAKLPNYHFDCISYWIDKVPSVTASLVKVNLQESIFDLTEVKERVVEKSLADKYYKVAKVFLEVLGVEKISIYDDFFKLGGDSLLAISLATKLRQDYKISVDDVFNHKTVADIVTFVPSTRSSLCDILEQIKLIYSKKDACLVSDRINILLKERNCLQKAIRFSFKKRERDSCNILLTGATGHIGCNLLYQLLHKTSHRIYLLIRASSNEEAKQRVNDKFKYYFNIDLENYENRIIVLAADVEQSELGITKVMYNKLIDNIDCIIHAAALVKHYGNYSMLYRANVQATINLLDLARQTKSKEFHYISTLAVLLNGYVANHSCYIFDEDEDVGILLGRNNLYAKTKYEGELVVNKYREYGVNSNIYRLGNVAMHSATNRHQTNIEDNAFYVTVKTILNIGVIANEIDMVEISPVDSVALAITKIFNQTSLINMTHHVFNPYWYKLSWLLTEMLGSSIKTLSIEDFLGIIIKELNFDITSKQIELFMLHQQWLQNVNLDQLTRIDVINYKTEVILTKLDFMWPQITKNMILGMLNQN